jgi:hypothetical protein
MADSDNPANDDGIHNLPSLNQQSSVSVINSDFLEGRPTEPAQSGSAMAAENSAEHRMSKNDSPHSPMQPAPAASSDRTSADLASIGCGTFYGSRRAAKKPLRFQ